MSDVSINVKALEGAAIPEYKTAGAAGADVCALVGSPVELNPGDRIAQIIVAPVTRGRFAVVEELDQTERGSGGFGSTGK